MAKINIPPSFTDLASAYNSPDYGLVNIIGVVTDLMPIKEIPTNRQHMRTFTVTDQSFRDTYPGVQGLTVRFFVSNADLIPKVGGIGDVVLLRQVKMVTFAGRKVALGNHRGVSLVFPSAAIPSPDFRITVNNQNKINCRGFPADIAKLSFAEQSYVIDVKAALSSTISPLIEKQSVDANRRSNVDLSPPAKRVKLSKAGSSVTTFGPKFRLISELENSCFADIVGQVVKRFEASLGRCEVYVTDYTENQQLFHYPTPEEEQTEAERDGDAFGYSGGRKKTWPGPYGFRVFKINIMPPHAEYASAHIEVGDFVLLRNVKCKVQAIGLRLEGDIWPDAQYPDKPRICKLRKDEPTAVQGIQNRKDQYWSARMRLHAEDKPKPAEAGNKKGKNKNKNKRKMQEEDSDGKNVDHSDTNRHVRCNHDDIRLVSVKDVLDPQNVRHAGVSPSGEAYTVPFVNARYRVKVRVVDFEPKALEEFSIPSTHLEDDASDSMDWVCDASPRHEWLFRLLLEDGNIAKASASTQHSRVWVDVGHQEAQFLFGNSMDDPRDLHSDTQQLAKLREKLFVLWGNLEEDGGEKLSNLLFECCISEYGVAVRNDVSSSQRHPLSGWERVYTMFGTTIM